MLFYEEKMVGNIKLNMVVGTNYWDSVIKSIILYDYWIISNRSWYCIWSNFWFYACQK